MEKSKFGGRAMEGLDELVEHHENQHDRSRRLSSDGAEDHGRPNPSEEERSVP
jgi:hypothetical protein